MDNNTTNGSLRKLGVKSFKYFISTFATFSIINTIFLIIAILKFNAVENLGVYILSILFVVIISIGFTILSCYFAYKYLLISSAKTIYRQHVTPIVEKSCAGLVNKLNVSESNTEKVATIGNVVHNYAQSSILGDRSKSWIYWLIAINIIVQLALLFCVMYFFT